MGCRPEAIVPEPVEQAGFGSSPPGENEEPGHFKQAFLGVLEKLNHLKNGWSLHEDERNFAGPINSYNSITFSNYALDIFTE